MENEIDDKMLRAIREESLKDLLREEERKIQYRQKSIKLFVSALAVAALLVVGLFVIRQHHSNCSQMALAYIEQIECQTVSRGDNDVATQYSGIISKLKEGREDVSGDISAFRTLLQENLEMDTDEKDWYAVNICYIEALAHLRNNDFAKAEPLLKKVSKSQSKYAAKASEILGKKR